MLFEVQASQILVRASSAFFIFLHRVQSLLGGNAVNKITTEELQRRQAAQGSVDMVLVDVRSVAETSVSMIPTAITKEQYENDLALYRDRLVIPYCTLGGRSFMYASRLAKSGVQTLNYQAGIIGWCSAGLPLTNPIGEPTTRVHVYTSFLKVPDVYDPVT